MGLAFKHVLMKKREQGVALEVDGRLVRQSVSQEFAPRGLALQRLGEPLSADEKTVPVIRVSATQGPQTTTIMGPLTQRKVRTMG